MQKGIEFIKGLVDLLTPEEFDYQINFLKVRLDEQEHSIRSAQEPCFYQWFVKTRQMSSTCPCLLLST